MADRCDRKHPAHGVFESPFQPTIVWNTVCTKRREPWLANEAVHQLLRAVWSAFDQWRVGPYVILPDHIQFLAGKASEMPFDPWVTAWKAEFSRRHNEPTHRWLTDHWDTRVRSRKHYNELVEYIFRNPRKHKLVDDPADWPYCGELFQLGWDGY